MDPQRTGPSRGWYWVAGAVGVLAAVLAVVVVVRGVVDYVDAIDDFQRVSAPGEGVVTLEAGEHQLYWEPAFGPLEPVPLTAVRVVGPGHPVVDTSVSKVTYDVSGHRGISIAEVEVPASGQYLVGSQGPGFAQGAIAIGDEPEGKLFVGIGIAVAIVLLAGAIGGTIVAVVAIRRHDAYWRRERSRWEAGAPARPSPSASPSPPPPPPPAPGPGPGAPGAPGPPGQGQA